MKLIGKRNRKSKFRPNNKYVIYGSLFLLEEKQVLLESEDLNERKARRDT